MSKGGDRVIDYAQLYDLYFHDVYRYLLRLSGDSHLAEDITSDTFFRAMRAIDSFRGECDVRVWLCQIARNCYFSYLKKNSRVQSMDDDAWRTIPDSAPSVEDDYARKEEVARIEAALHELREPYREVFMWRVYAELSFRQIAGIFGKTENWACVTYHRARNMIKERLEGEK